MNKFHEIKKIHNFTQVPLNSTLFMSVRNPFDRLVSAYFNKAFPLKLYDGDISGYYKLIQQFALENFEHKNLTGLGASEIVLHSRRAAAFVRRTERRKNAGRKRGCGAEARACALQAPSRRTNCDVTTVRSIARL